MEVRDHSEGGEFLLIEGRGHSEGGRVLPY